MLPVVLFSALFYLPKFFEVRVVDGIGPTGREESWFDVTELRTNENYVFW